MRPWPILTDERAFFPRFQGKVRHSAIFYDGKRRHRLQRERKRFTCCENAPFRLRKSRRRPPIIQAGIKMDLHGDVTLERANVSVEDRQTVVFLFPMGECSHVKPVGDFQMSIAENEFGAEDVRIGEIRLSYFQGVFTWAYGE